MVETVKTMLRFHRLIKLDATNRNLANSNQKSNEIFTMSAQKNYQVLAGRLILMKQDLDFVFKKIRLLKSKLEAKYPEQYDKAFQTVQTARKLQQDPGDEDEEEEEEHHARPSPQKTPVASQPKDAHPAVLKERSTSVTSTGSGSVLFAGIMEKARMGKDLVNGLMNTAISKSQVQEPATEPVETPPPPPPPAQ